MVKQILTIKVPPRPARILYIGSGTTTPGITYLHALQDAGFNIYHVGEGSRQFDITHIPKKPFIVRTPTGNAHVMIRNLPLKALLDMIGYEFDLIFHVQDWTYFTDMERSPIPYFFYCTEIAYTFIHKSVWVVLAATEAIKQIVMQEAPQLQGFVYHPHSVLMGHEEVKFPDMKTRTNSVFFAGEVYRLGELYEERRKVIKFIEDVKDASIHYLAPPGKNPQEMRKAEKGIGLLNSKQYTDFLLESKIGINIPTIGGANFRDVEVPATGAMLVTRRTPDMDMMGFEDYVNCRFYDTPDEAREIILNGYDPEIAKAGWELVVRGRRWFKHQNPYFLYRGTKANKDQTQESIFELPKELFESLKPVLENLKNEKIINDFRYLDSITKLCLDFNSIDFDTNLQKVFQTLGFTEWAQAGHTIYHRIKELATLWNNMLGINIPKKVFENIPK